MVQQSSPGATLSDDAGQDIAAAGAAGTGTGVSRADHAHKIPAGLVTPAMSTIPILQSRLIFPSVQLSTGIAVITGTHVWSYYDSAIGATSPVPCQIATTTNAAVNDTIVFTFDCEAGTYTILNGVGIGGTSGEWAFSIDAAAAYWAYTGAWYNALHAQAGVVLTAGTHTLTVKCTSAASAATYLGMMALKRTA